MAIVSTRRARHIGAGALALAALTASLTACSASDSNGSDAAEGDVPDGVLVDASTCERNRDAGTIVYVSGYGYSASAGQMDVFLADDLGYFEALCLDVEINASGANGQQLVGSGQAQFTALGSASDVVLAAANNDNLVAVATYGTEPPFSIFANEKIESLKDLEGGSLGYFINLTPIASAMLDAADVDSSEVDMIKMTNYDPTVVTRGQVDAIVGYASNQPQTLRAMDESFTEFLPADVGVSGTYNVMEANGEFLREHPEAAADFMRASLHALQYCLDEEDDCLDTLAEMAKDANQGDAFPREQLARTWAVESEWVRNSAGGNPGVHTHAMWEPELEIVAKYGDISEIPALEDMMDVDLVADLYDGDELAWPAS
ncbi:ABC transporter substrate-binding protein [Demequina sp. SO4-18]|uniref:ABC transporter substrate-binding protein n=1 Tax=Demequina sp. SO4-18 TaxID=3401026 RepID=UPI003B59453E